MKLLGAAAVGAVVAPSLPQPNRLWPAIDGEITVLWAHDATTPVVSTRYSRLELLEISLMPDGSYESAYAIKRA